jgi:hypothetical protein
MSGGDAGAGRKLKDIRLFIDELYDGDLHAKRVGSLVAAALGVMSSASLAVSMIGQAVGHCATPLSGYSDRLSQPAIMHFAYNTVGWGISSRNDANARARFSFERVGNRPRLG